jgi:hypothetical protein
MTKRLLLVFGPLNLLFLALVVLVQSNLGEMDFLGYWSSSRLLINRQNPYDLDLLLALQQEQRPLRFAADPTPVMIWNPPWLLLALTPLALLPFDAARLLWIVVNFCGIGLAVAWTWKQLDSSPPDAGFTLALAAALLFPAAGLLIRIGQVSLLVLLGIGAVWWALQARRPLWQDILAGSGLALASFKPHLVYWVAAILLFRALRDRRWGLFAGAALAFGGTALLAWRLYPNWLPEYIARVISLPYDLLATSTIGSLARETLGWTFLRFSAVILLPFFPWFLQTYAREPLTAFNLALLVSLPLSPYGFSFDQVLLLPAIVQCVFWLWKSHPHRQWVILCAGLLALVYGFYLALIRVPGITYSWMVLPVFGLLGIFVLVWKHRIPPAS